jgi:hypothetical protein
MPASTGDRDSSIKSGQGIIDIIHNTPIDVTDYQDQSEIDQ